MHQVKLAVILAAGLGIRMRPFTVNHPKGFLTVGGLPLIIRSLNNLLKAGIQEIIIGTGHKKEKFEELADRYPVTCVYNQDYARTGSMFTLYQMKNLIQSDFLLLESDILYDPSGLETLINNPAPNIVLASGFTNAGDEVFLEVNKTGHLTAVSKRRSQLHSVFGELTGISKVSAPAFNAMNEFASKRFKRIPKLDYEYVMAGVSGQDKFYVLKIEDYTWCEIDDLDHLEHARDKIYPRIVQEGI